MSLSFKAETEGEWVAKGKSKILLVNIYKAVAFCETNCLLNKD